MPRIPRLLEPAERLARRGFAIGERDHVVVEALASASLRDPLAETIPLRRAHLADPAAGVVVEEESAVAERGQVGEHGAIVLAGEVEQARMMLEQEGRPGPREQ